MRFLDDIDPRLRATLLAAYEEQRHQLVDPLPRGTTIVLAGHRAAGKSTLLRKVGAALGRAWVDLDGELERRSGRLLREWVQSDERSFRLAERETFRDLPPGRVVAVGGGFLASHRDVLADCLVVLVPISFDTYRERLLADRTRPRLRPQLSLEDELREVFHEREEAHRQARPTSMVDFVLRLERGIRPRRVVTLPPEGDPQEFAWRALHHGAELLEVRNDLHALGLPVRLLSRALPLLISERGQPLPLEWEGVAALIDRPLLRGLPMDPRALVSFHAEAPLSTAEALEHWEGVAPGPLIKHVEPLGELSTAPRLFETRTRLAERFGAERVTVLATGPLALPFRAVLARRNAFDYLALDGAFAGAPGQRLVADAAREYALPSADGERERLGIFGHGIAHSRSPRIHPQPFDRIDLPEGAELAPLLQALRPHYRGFAVTAPFKRQAAAAAGGEHEAVNTLVRLEGGYQGSSSDEAGAEAVLEALKAPSVTVLGDGGVGSALRAAAARLSVQLRFVSLNQVTADPLTGAVVWTWPAQVDAPAELHFREATVAVIAYGTPGKLIAARILARGGTPKALGARWFIAQARAQRALWPPLHPLPLGRGPGRGAPLHDHFSRQRPPRGRSLGRLRSPLPNAPRRPRPGHRRRARPAPAPAPAPEPREEVLPRAPRRRGRRRQVAPARRSVGRSCLFPSAGRDGARDRRWHGGRSLHRLRAPLQAGRWSLHPGTHHHAGGGGLERGRQGRGQRQGGEERAGRLPLRRRGVALPGALHHALGLAAPRRPLRGVEDGGHARRGALLPLVSGRAVRRRAHPRSADAQAVGGAARSLRDEGAAGGVELSATPSGTCWRR